MENYTPNKAQFLKLAKKGNLIPVYREILADLETPVSCFLKIGDSPYSYLLESVEQGSAISRYSFIASNPSLVLKSRGKTISMVRPGKSEESFETKSDPFAELEKILKKYKYVNIEGLPPFSGGAVGYIGYDMIRFIENIPNKNKDGLNIPDSFFMFTDTIYIFDHFNKKIKVLSNVCLDDFKSPELAYDQAIQKIEAGIKKLRSTAIPEPHRPSKNPKPLKMESNFTKPAFEKAVKVAKEHITAGDIFQVVLSQRFKLPIRCGAFDIYRALRSINPSPYMFYLNCHDFGDTFQLVGSSPEVHVRCESRKASLRPIAGTRPRGKNLAADKRLEKDLLADPKEKAEHLMLVDLGRNDLGRVCDYSTVKVPEFMTIERYSHVMHIVSLVEGELQKDKTVFDLLRATFPAGTISGAPKVRAMEIIDALESQKRSFYSGVVGYFSYSGNLDSCITIRTALVKDGAVYAQAGAGIVTDSKPAKEYEETLNKAKGIFKAVEMAESGAL